MRVFLFVICVFVCRIQLRRSFKTVVYDHRLTKIGTASSLMLLSLPFLPISEFLSAFLIIVHHILISHLNDFYEWMKLRKAELARLSAITRLIVQMQMGDSLRTSLNQLSESERDPFWKRQWSKLSTSVAFSPQDSVFRNPILRTFCRDLCQCDRSSFQQLNQLREIRQIYKKESDFRRRSGQVMLQLRLQAMILFGLHLAVTAFMIHQFGWSSHKLIFLFSFLLMSMGLLALVLMGRRKKWNT